METNLTAKRDSNSRSFFKLAKFCRENTFIIVFYYLFFIIMKMALGSYFEKLQSDFTSAYKLINFPE